MQAVRFSMFQHVFAATIAHSMAQHPHSHPHRAGARQLAGHEGCALITNETLHALYVDLLSTAQMPANAVAASTLRAVWEAETVLASPTDVAVTALAGNGLLTRDTLAERMACATQRALDQQVRGSEHAVVVFTEKETLGSAAWKETLTFAARHLLPLVIAYTATQDISAIAADCGVPWIAADSKDAVALYRVACESLGHARRGNGPTILAAVELADTATTSATQLMEQYLAARGLWSQQLAHTLAKRAMHRRTGDGYLARG